MQHSATVVDRGSGPDASRAICPRRSERVRLSAVVVLRLPGSKHSRVNVHDLSLHGCRIDFVQRPRIEDRVWVKLGDFEPLEAQVCWVQGCTGGVAFERPLHPAVFDVLIERIG